RIEQFFTVWEAGWEDLTPASDFNTFALLQRTHEEVIHTQFLAWLFDRHGDHGQRHLFMSALLDLCSLSPRDDWERGYVVRPEFARAEAQIDIMVARCFDFLIYIENKINAGDQRRQVDREFRDMRRTGGVMHVPAERQVAVYVTRTGRDPTSGDTDRWLCISHEQLAAALRPALEHVSSRRVRFIVEDWMRTVRSWRQ
ncbi:MAG: PD-(D/E)XK nuclease family protein, partial [Armatimonadota bacterium]